FVTASLLALALGTRASGVRAQGGGLVLGGGGGGGNGPVISISNGPAGANLPPLPTGTGAISGVITDGSSQRPLGQAIVLLRLVSTFSGPGTTSRNIGRQITDPKGRFVFTDLPAMDGYSLSVSKPGYFDGAFGADPGTTSGSNIFLTD